MATFDREHLAKYAAEFSGAMFLIMFVKLASAFGGATTSLSIGLGLGLLIYNFGYISGAHLNPAVTAACIVRDIPGFPRSDLGQIIMYFLSQYAGGIVGGMIAIVIGGDSAAGVYPTVGETYLGDTNRLLQAFIGEIFFTYLLCTTVIHTATDKRQDGNQFYGISIGLSLSLGIACIGPISGCCLNTAVWVGTVVSALAADKAGGLSDAWIYWVGTFLGGILAGLFFNLLNGRESLKKGSYKPVEENLEMEETQIE